ncbi:hypothetical protein WJX77_011604 [Trebouxia sp. C0004]
MHLEKYDTAIASLQTALNWNQQIALFKCTWHKHRKGCSSHEGSTQQSNYTSGRIKQTGGHSPVTPAPSLASNIPR